MARPQRLKSSLAGASPVNPPEPAEPADAAPQQAPAPEAPTAATAPATPSDAGEDEPKKKMGRPKGTGRNVDTKTRSVTIQLDILEESLNAVDFLKTNPAAPRTFTSCSTSRCSR
ncbi:hypothetical protein GS532_21470 [Rhodococcus hoagii]|nr:hypothetical protein [Prescottella equi]